METKHFIEQYTIKFQSLEIASRIAWWKLATLGDDVYAKQYQESQTAIRKMHSSKEECTFVCSNKNNSDPLLQRQMTLVSLDYRQNQISPELIEKQTHLESEVESVYTNFRPIIQGKSLSNNDLKKILTDSTDSRQRQEAWEASKQIGEQVEEKVLELISLRNESAKQAGFSDYYSMRLELQELDQDRLFKLLAELDRLTTPHWQKYKPDLDANLTQRFGISFSDLRPWHYQDPFFQEAPQGKLDFDRFFKGKEIVDIGTAYYRFISMPVEDIIERSDLYERDKKSQHAFCTCIDRAQDIRILCNLRDNEYWMGTLLHELGHAVYDKYISQSLPYLLRIPAHISSTEAIAMLFGRMSRNGNFIHKYCDIDKQKANELNGIAKQATAASLLVLARWILVMAHFERTMYQQKNIDLNAFWWDCVEKFQWVKRVPNRNKPDWASKLHLACAPVYYQNYILGELTASQLLYNLQKQIKNNNGDSIHSPETGEWLKSRFLTYGAQFPWEETLRKATGEPLNPHYFASDIAVHEKK